MTAVIIIPGSKLATRILVKPNMFNPIAKIITPPVAVISIMNLKKGRDIDAADLGELLEQLRFVSPGAFPFFH